MRSRDKTSAHTHLRLMCTCTNLREINFGGQLQFYEHKSQFPIYSTFCTLLYLKLKLLLKLKGAPTNVVFGNFSGHLVKQNLFYSTPPTWDIP